MKHRNDVAPLLRVKHRKAQTPHMLPLRTLGIHHITTQMPHAQKADTFVPADESIHFHSSLAFFGVGPVPTSCSASWYTFTVSIELQPHSSGGPIAPPLPCIEEDNCKLPLKMMVSGDSCHHSSTSMILAQAFGYQSTHTHTFLLEPYRATQLGATRPAAL